MQTAHTEVMHTLVKLCKTDPYSGAVAFEPIRDKMLELYGSTIDHPDFHHAFRVVMDSGGSKSPHMKDMHDFTSVHVNPRMRKLRLETYAVVAPLAVDRPRLKNALVKWAWKQPPVRGWCPVSPSIAHRLDSQSRFQMTKACKGIEESMIQGAKIATAVAGVERDKIRWIGEVDIALVSKLLAVPKYGAGTLRDLGDYD